MLREPTTKSLLFNKRVCAQPATNLASRAGPGTRPGLSRPPGRGPSVSGPLENPFLPHSPWSPLRPDATLPLQNPSWGWKPEDSAEGLVWLPLLLMGGEGSAWAGP